MAQNPFIFPQKLKHSSAKKLTEKEQNDIWETRIIFFKVYTEILKTFLIRVL